MPVHAGRDYLCEYDGDIRRFVVRWLASGRVIGYVETFFDGEAVADAYSAGLEAGQARTQQQDTRKAISLSEAARQLGVSRTSLYKLIGRGELQSFRIESRRLIPVSSIDAYIAQQQTAPEPVDMSILETRPYVRRVG